MKVVVELENGKRFTYEAEGVEVGTHVELPKPYFLTPTTPIRWGSCGPWSRTTTVRARTSFGYLTPMKSQR